MYRIELSPGEETAFRSIEELAVAIRRKVVTSKARIYHNATSRWLPIQFHPHYKIALSMPLTQADLVAGPPVTPLSGLKLGDSVTPPAPASSSKDAATQAALTAWPAPKPVAPPTAQPFSQPVPKEPAASGTPITLGTPAPEPRRSPEPQRTMKVHRAESPRAEPARVVEPARSAPVRAKSPRKSKKSRRSLHLALGGAVLAACVQLMIAAASSPRSQFAERIRTPRRLIEAPIETMQEDSPRTVAGVLPALQTIPLPRRTASARPAAQPVVPIRAKSTTPGPDALQDRSDVMGASVDTASNPEIQPAPPAAEISGSVQSAPVPVARTGDSTEKKILRGLLREIGGTPAPESKTPKR